MRHTIILSCLLGLVLASAPAYSKEVTSDTLSIDDVTPMLQEFVSLRPNQELLEVYGISQSNEDKQAKIFFRYKRGRPTRGELSCFKLNSGKWYCGGVYKILKK